MKHSSSGMDGIRRNGRPVLESLAVVSALGGILATSVLGSAGAASLGRLRGEIDPVPSQHWRQIFDPQNPAAPPRLVLDHHPVGRLHQTDQRIACVHAGDRILLDSDSDSSTALAMEAIALTSAAAGDRIEARITLTGAVVNARITTAGAGILIGRKEIWR